MTNVLGALENLGGMGARAVLDALRMVINAVGQGTGWTGDEIAELGQLEQMLADKVRDIESRFGGGGTGGGAGGGTGGGGGA